MQQSVVDLFKKYKLQQSKDNHQKKGKVKWTHQKALGRKVLAIQGIVGSTNYIKFPLQKNTINTQRYIYLQCSPEAGHSFSIVFTINLNSRQFKLILNSLCKQHKKLNNQYTIPIDIAASRWSIVVVDLWSIVEDLLENKEKRILLELTQIQLRATLKIKGMFASNLFFEADDLPKQLTFPLHNGQLFYQNYRYYLINRSDQTIQVSCISKAIKPEKQQTKILEEQSIQNKTLSSAKSISKIKQTPKPAKVIGTKDKQISNKPPIKYTQDMQVPQPQPKPSATIQCSFQFQQGSSLSFGQIRCIQQCLITPNLIYTHKPIVIFKKISEFVIIVAYNDATMAYFHLLSKTPIKYFQTQLELVSGMEVDSKGILVVWGLDRLRRWVLMLIQQEAILFRQISNYEIFGLLLLGKSYKQGIMTFGKMSIRVWSVKKDMIVGSNLYLGQFARNTQFTDGVIIDGKCLISSSTGNLFTIRLQTSQIQTVQKLQEQRIDHIKKLQSNRILTTTQSGIVKVYSPLFQILFQTNLHCRIKNLVVKNTNQLILNHYDGTTGKLLLSQGKYQFLHRCHQGSIIDLKYHPKCKRLVSISQDSTIRVWRLIGGGQDIQQQYQFQVHAECMGSLAMCDQYAFLVGFQSGVIRKFDLKQFRMVQQKQHSQEMITNIQVSKGDMYTLISDKHFVFLLDQNLNVLNKYEIQPQQKCCIGFNLKTMLFYFTTRKTELSIFSLKSLERIISISLESIPNQIHFQNQWMHVLTMDAHLIFKNNKFLKMIRLPKHESAAMQYPLFALSACNSLNIGVQATLQFRQEAYVPESLDGIVFSKDQEQLLFGWGSKSFTIYGWRLQTRNLNIALQYQEYQQFSTRKQEQEPEIIIKQIPIQSPNPQIHQCMPSQLKPLYPSYQSFFPPQHENDNQFLAQVIEQQMQQLSNNIKCQSIHPELLIGWNYQQPIHYLFWNQQHRYIVYPSGNDLIVQYFEQKTRQKIFKLAFKPQKIHGCHKYFSFSVGTTVWLYNSDTVKFYKSIAMEGDKILQYQFSKCQSFLIFLLEMKTKMVIAVLDILTGKVIVSSYSELSVDPALLEVNSFKDRLQFHILKTSQFSFYRITSIQTLETQTLNLQQAINKTGNILCSTYAKIGKDDLILMGTLNGSIIVIDSRSGSLTLICVSVVKSPITHIKYLEKSLILITNSVNIYIWKDITDLGEIAERVAEKTQNVLTLDSVPVAVTQFSQGNNLILISRLGIQWLVDIQDLMTIKLMSVHTKQITCCQFFDGKIVTGSKDGAIKFTNSLNLQVQLELFKPKKIVHSILFIQELQIFVGCHGNSICFYKNTIVLGSCEFQSPTISMKHLKGTKNILVATRKQVMMLYFVSQDPFRIQIQRLTDFTSLISLQLNSFNHFNIWLCSSSSGKVNVWTRKCLKRMSNPAQQLSNVHQLQYYLVDNYQPSHKSQSSLCKFTSLNTYLCANECKLLQRNYNQHLILRQLNISQCSCIQIFEDKVILGDSQGSISIIDRHGMVIQKVKVMESINGLVLSGKYLIAYGSKVAKCLIS